MNTYSFDELNRFVIKDFTAGRPFSSFLPGIAGQNGIPLWVFYVNRGQAIASFGVESKDHPIMEFQPANKAYRHTPFTGFRTFLKINSDDSPQFYEPFSPWTRSDQVVQRMMIGMNELELEEHQLELGLQTNVLYYVLPGEDFAGLVRKVTLSNRSDQSLSFEVLDGLPIVIPFGVDNSALKEINRTIEAWMAVYNLENNVPFYRLRGSTQDTAEVGRIEAGHFAVSFFAQGDAPRLLPPIVDPELIFGYNMALTVPDRFIRTPLEQLLEERQISSGKTPCGFFGSATTLSPGATGTIYSVFGHTGNEKHLSRWVDRLCEPAFLDAKHHQSRTLAVELTDPIETQSGSKIFNAYCRQAFLDNLLRGGWPLLLDRNNPSLVYHIYSRKHGDPERDYNDFSVAAEPYSQGELNYRDVNQNRRSDVLFNPQVADFNIRAFMSLIQSDGYNPLVVRGVKFTLSEENRQAIISLVEQPDKLKKFLAGSFTPGELLIYIKNNQVKLRVLPEDFLATLLKLADHHFSAVHGEGYWVDHWTYNLDLIDSYLKVYPDLRDELLFTNGDLPFYDNLAIVKPRAQKYVLANGVPRQLNAVTEDPEKVALITSREMLPFWMRADHGRGEIYQTTLFAKLLILAVVKFTTLDPLGMGIEMEAGKPGWYDAMNGLPGLFGASMPETYALQRLLSFLLAAIEGKALPSINLPIEVWNLMSDTAAALQAYKISDDYDPDFAYWETVSGARERYRATVRLGFNGREHPVRVAEISQILAEFQDKVQLGSQRAIEYTEGIPPTYFAYRVKDYEIIQDPRGEIVQDEDNRPFIRVKRFEPIPLPLFLEGPVRALRLQNGLAAARRLYQRVKSSPLFDQKLKMYKVNASLADQPHDIGRARAFTPGWLENESIWLHMEYKYLLEVLKAGLYDEFFEDFNNALIPFQDPARYGRNPLENSSFLVSSAHPDESLHGAGFVARFSGATAEFLSIWELMMAGPVPFFMQESELHLRLQPALPGWLFTADKTISFQFLGQCQVTYHNLSGGDLVPNSKPTRIELILEDNQGHSIHGPVIPPPYAERVRAGTVSQIDQFYK